MADTDMEVLPDDPVWDHGRVAGSGGIMLHYVRLGQGDPVLLLHGWPGFWYDWRRVLLPLSTDADVIAPDFRGFGDSDKPDLPPAEGYTLAVLTEDLVTLLVPALPQPSLVRPAHHSRPGDRAPVPGALLRPLVPTEGGGQGAGVRGHHRRVRSSRCPCREHCLLPRPRRRQAGPGHRAPGGITDPAPHGDRLGALDPVIPAAWADRLGETFPNHELSLLPGVGHFVPLEAPERTIETILRALSLTRQEDSAVPEGPT